MEAGFAAHIVRGSEKFTIALALLAASALVAEAAPFTSAQRCEGRKNQVAGKYAACLGTAEKQLLLRGNSAPYNKKRARCEAYYARDWQAIEAISGAGVCPSEADASDIADYLDACMASVAGALAGGPLGLDPVTCNTALAGALEANASCDAGAIRAPLATPVCPAAACAQTCDPVDTSRCYVRGSEYVCPTPSCTCGSIQTTTTCTMPAPDCNPICEPPACGIRCEPDQCGDATCPTCDGICGEATCTASCSNWDLTHPCAATFGCSIATPTCITVCKRPKCYWHDREASGTPPACEAPLPASLTAPGQAGLDCSPPTGPEVKDWAILCHKPECEILCPAAATACSGEAQCDVDCTDPICEVTCDPPVCEIDSPTGTTVCSPPENCTTTCRCRVGACTRSK